MNEFSQGESYSDMDLLRVCVWGCGFVSAELAQVRGNVSR